MDPGRTSWWWVRPTRQLTIRPVILLQDSRFFVVRVDASPTATPVPGGSFVTVESGPHRDMAEAWLEIDHPKQRVRRRLPPVTRALAAGHSCSIIRGPSPIRHSVPCTQAHTTPDIIFVKACTPVWVKHEPVGPHPRMLAREQDVIAAKRARLEEERIWELGGKGDYEAAHPIGDRCPMCMRTTLCRAHDFCPPSQTRPCFAHRFFHQGPSTVACAGRFVRGQAEGPFRSRNGPLFGAETGSGRARQPGDSRSLARTAHGTLARWQTTD